MSHRKSTRLVAIDSGAEAFADGVVMRLRAIDEALWPIVGRRGVDAVYQRSLHVTARTHEWLHAATDVHHTMDLAGLKAVLMRQSVPAARAGGIALLQAFDEVLVFLIGSSLVQRLLHPVPPDAADTLSTAQGSP